MMNIIYLTSTYSQQRFDELTAKKAITKMPQAQKYHHLLLEGLRKVCLGELTVISSYPVTNDGRRKHHYEEELEDGIKYIYPSFINMPFLRQFMLWINTIKLVFKYAKLKDSIIICDILNSSIFYAARFVRMFKRIKIVGIVTDVPGHTSGARAKLLPWWKRQIVFMAEKLMQHTVSSCDAYLLLTDAMNKVVNPKGKPYIVIEGHADITMKDRENSLANKTKEKTMMYAGGTHKEFGIAMLVDAFLSLNSPEWALHIYGDGNYQKELVNIAAEHKNVVYHGLCPNAEVVNAQLKAWLLVNPRITNAEYIKYSFPSKTLECMVSGTPLLTTRLAGMPKDYYPYVYLFGEETKEGFESVLKDVLVLSAEELHERGKKAKEFAIQQKNNVKQAEHFYSFIDKVYYDN